MFTQAPTWEECLRAGIFTSPQLDRFFGSAVATSGGGSVGQANYAQCAKYGIGRIVIGKMLEGTENENAIREAN